MKIGMNLLLWTGHVGEVHAPVLRALKTLGYDGWLTIEAFGRVPDLAAAIRVGSDFFAREAEVYTEGNRLIRENWGREA
ncbi:MAG TPA: hypothetical protein VF481_06870 [Novosphingobium sp.]